MKKLILIVVAIIIAGLAALFLPENIEKLVLQELEEQGKRVFGTDVMVSDIAVDIKQGSATIREISIANPSGYSQPNAMTLSSIAAKFDYQTLVIEEILISQPQVFAEFKGKDLNILDLANHAEAVKRNEKSLENGNNPEPKSEKQDKQEEQDQPLVLTIKLAALENASVDIQSDLTDKRKQFSIERLEARDLHGDSGQLANQLVEGLFNDLAKQVISESVKTLEQEALEKLKDKAKEKLKKLLD